MRCAVQVLLPTYYIQQPIVEVSCYYHQNSTQIVIRILLTLKYLINEYTHWPNSLDCTDLKISVEPAVTQYCVASVTYKV